MTQHNVAYTAETAETLTHPAYDFIKLAQETIETEIKGLSILKESLGQSFQQTIETLYKTKGRVVVSGVGKSGHVARKIAATMASLGTPAQYIHPTEASHGDLGMLSEDDTVILLSWSGETRELSDTIAYTRRFSIPLIAITGNQNSALGKHSDICIQLPQAPEACPFNMAPTTSTTMMIALGDALAIALMSAKGFERDDYGIRHPGGKLGAMFTHVMDIMHVTNLPIVHQSTKMSDAIPVMVKINLGALIAVNDSGQVSGILTDGDIKRNLSPDFLDKSLQDIATPSPLCIQPDALAVKAMKLMSDRKRPISELIVTDSESKPIGLLQMYQCLEAGL